MDGFGGGYLWLGAAVFYLLLSAFDHQQDGNSRDSVSSAFVFILTEFAMKTIIYQFSLWVIIFLGVFLTPLYWLQSWMSEQTRQFVTSLSDLTLLLMQRTVKILGLPIGQTLHQLWDGLFMGTAFLILPWAIIIAYLIYRFVVFAWRRYVS